MTLLGAVGREVYVKSCTRTVGAHRLVGVHPSTWAHCSKLVSVASSSDPHLCISPYIACESRRFAVVKPTAGGISLYELHFTCLATAIQELPHGNKAL